MISLSERSQNVTPSSTLAITAKINVLIADGVDVVKTKSDEKDCNFLQ
jgi:aspartate aminotransferase